MPRCRDAIALFAATPHRLIAFTGRLFEVIFTPLRYECDILEAAK